MVDNVLSQILYGISGFLFGIFAVRNYHWATAKIKKSRIEYGPSLGFITAALPAILLSIIAIFLFPLFLYTRTQVGGFIYLATFIFYNMKGRQKK